MIRSVPTVDYRRNRVPGGAYFFTVTLANRQSSLLIEHVSLLGEAMRQVRTRHPFETLAIVVLPEYLQMSPVLICGAANPFR